VTQHTLARSREGRFTTPLDVSQRRLFSPSRWCGQVVAIAVALLHGPAFAQSEGEPETTRAPKMEDEARRLFKDGNAFLDAGQYEAALSAFEAAHVAWPNPKIMLNTATTLRALGRNAEALQAYRRYSSAAQPTPERKAEVDAICDELLSRVATVSLAVDPDARNVTLDGHRLDEASRSPLFIDPGEHVLVSLGPGGERVLSFEVQAGETRELALLSSAPAIDRASETTQPPALEHSTGAHRFSLWARADIDGFGRGMLGSGGLGYTLGTSWQVAAGALIGARRGAWAGLERFVGEGSFQPSIGLSIPVFFTGSAHAGVSLDAGARWAMGADLFLRGRAAVVHFFSAPEGYSTTVFVPSLGLEWQL
jgi:tetratricopeptide (TPR) repeat protein